MRKATSNLTKMLAAAGLAAAIAAPLSAQTYQPYTPQQTFQDRFDREQLRGRQYVQLRSLARDLDAYAREAAREASRAAYRGGFQERRIFNRMNDVARRAAELRLRLDTNAGTTWDVRREIDSLEQIARRVDFRMRTSGGFRRAFDEWHGVLTTLDRMDRVLDGYGVRVPPVYRRY